MSDRQLLQDVQEAHLSAMQAEEYPGSVERCETLDLLRRLTLRVIELQENLDRLERRGGL